MTTGKGKNSDLIEAHKYEPVNHLNSNFNFTAVLMGQTECDS